MLLAAGERPADLLLALLQAREKFVDLLQILRQLGAWPRVRAHLQILFHGHAGKNTPSLGTLHKPVLHDLIGRHRADHLAHELDRTAFRLQKAGDRIQNGAFSGAVRTDQRHDLAVGDLQRDALDRVDRAVINMKILYPQHRQPSFFLPR